MHKTVLYTALIVLVVVFVVYRVPQLKTLVVGA
jgi:hypothetical protein